MTGTLGESRFCAPNSHLAGAVRAISASLLALIVATPALAQNAAPQDTPAQRAYVENGDIIVTARKRQESILKVPVVLTAVSEKQLTTSQVTSVTDLPRLVPGLVIAGNILSIGPQVTIRGVGTSSYDPGVDQSVSLNVDGLSLGQGLAFGSAMFDVGQVEVLKGPQALFYGKSSPGGVISLRTADPTDKFEVIARAGYEVEAREGRGELIVSGPLSKQLLARVSTMYSRGQGYFINNAVADVATGALAPTHRRNPQPRNFVIRGTLLFKPDDSSFSARLKVNHAYDHSENAELKQLAHCLEPGQSFTFGSGLPGSPIPAAPNFLTPVDPLRFIGNDNCKNDRYAPQVYLDPSAFPGIPNGGVPYLQDKQDFGTLELNYDVASQVTLTSTTAYYNLKSSSSVNPTLTVAAAPAFAVTNRFRRREFTQELRANSDFSTPLNFSLGAFYENGQLRDRVHFIRNTRYGFLSPGIVGADILNDDRQSTIDIKTYSLFGQLRYKLTPQLELAAGARWSDETRSFHVYDFQHGIDITPTLPVTRNHSSTVSPEATLTYTPTDDLTVFGSYKKGFKSGSFSVAVPANPGENKNFGDEKVSGYEIGVKSRLADRQVLANIAFYDYRYKGLQVGGIEGFKNGSPVIRTVNAGSSRTYGIDFDVAYRPAAVEGLSLNGSINWNKARYKVLDTIGCYPNQTVAQGCNTLFNPSATQSPVPTGAVLVNGVYGFYTAQNLNGAQMIRAPEWTANVGFDYEMPVGSGMKLHLSNNNQFSTRYPSYLALGRPNNDNFQKGYVKVDASIALKSDDERWEVALIGKNIGDKLISSNCAASNTAYGGVLGGEITGGSTMGAAGYAEELCFPDGGGRSVWIRLTFKPFGG